MNLRHFLKFKKKYTFYPLFILRIILFVCFFWKICLKVGFILNFNKDRKTIKASELVEDIVSFLLGMPLLIDFLHNKMEKGQRLQRTPTYKLQTFQWLFLVNIDVASIIWKSILVGQMVWLFWVKFYSYFLIIKQFYRRKILYYYVTNQCILGKSTKWLIY